MYINIQTSQYPVSEAEIRAAFPNTSFPMPFQAPEDYAVVFPTPRPSFNATTHGVREDAPTQISGKWYQAWVTYPLPADVVAANQAAAKQRLVDEVVFNTQKRLDEFAKTRNYDGILSAASYATSTNEKFGTEGQHCVAMRDATWAKLYEMLAEVEAGTRPIPTGYSDVEPELPALTWPNP